MINISDSVVILAGTSNYQYQGLDDLPQVESLHKKTSDPTQRS